MLRRVLMLMMLKKIEQARDILSKADFREYK